MNSTRIIRKCFTDFIKRINERERKEMFEKVTIDQCISNQMIH